MALRPSSERLRNGAADWQNGTFRWRRGSGYGNLRVSAESTVHRNDCFYLRRVPAGGDSADVGGLRRVACAGADCDWIRRTRVAWTAGRAVRRILPEGAAIYSLPDAGARKVNSNADAEECA